MKLILIIVLLGFNLSIAYSQTKDSTDIYQEVLGHHLDYLKSLNKNLEMVFVELNQTTQEFPNTINGIKIRYLNGADIKSMTKNRKIELIVVRPAEVSSNSIKINVIDFGVHYKNNIFHYSNGGGSSFEYKFDCTINTFYLASKNQGGI